MANYYDEAKGWIIDGQSLEDFEEANEPITEENLQDLGILEKDEKPKTPEEQRTRPKDLEFEDTSEISFDETMADIGYTMKDEWKRAFHTKANEERYFERTELAKTVRELQRVFVGSLAADAGIVAAGAVAGSVVPVVGTATGATVGGAIVAARKIKLLIDLAPKIVKLSKAAQTLKGQLALGAGIDFALSRKEDNEGNLSNALESLNVPFAEAFAQHDEDPAWLVRGKTAIHGLVAGGLLFGGLKLGKKGLEKLGIKASKEAKQVTEQTLEETTEAVNEINKALDNKDIIDKVKTTIQQCDEQGVEDVERFLLDSEWVKENGPDKILDVYKRIVDGQELTVGDDGNIQTAVNSWRDAAHVTPKQLKAQTSNDGVELMEEAVKDTWKERGWLAENEDLVKITNSADNSKTTKLTVNTKATNRIVKQYTDKWQIDNNVKVEWVDGQINGADGNTLATSYHGKTKNGDIHPNITIQINKNAKNPHVILRSELEHARDIAKRTVPNQKAQHFSRYTGKNESEMSLGYVKKKADSRLISKKVDGDLDNFLKTAKEGVNAETPYAHIRRITDVLTDDTLKNILEDVKDTVVRVMNKEEQQEVNKLVGSREFGNVRKDATGHYQIILNPNLTLEEARRTLYHELQHVKQLKRAEIDPEYKAKLDNYFSKTNKEDILSEDYFNNELELEANQAEVEWEKIRKSYNVHQSATGNVETQRTAQGSIEETSRRNSNREEYRVAGSSIDSSRRNLSIIRDGSSQYRTKIQQSDSRPISKQLTSTDGDLDQIEKVVSDVVARDTELSGTTWEALAKDADDLFNKLEEYGIKDIDNLKKAFNHGQIDVINIATRYALAAERIVGNLREQAAAILKQNGDITEIAESLAYLSDFTSKLGSALGRGLNEVKVVNKARTFFSLTTLEKQGLDNLTDLLYTDITSLNFTRNTKQLKAALYNKIQNYVGGAFFNELMANSGLRKNFDEIINKTIQLAKDGKLTDEIVNKELAGLVKKAKIKDVENALRFAVNDNKILTFMRNVNSYYITNLLSSPLTQMKNIISGLSNTVYFPMKKIIGGLIDLPFSPEQGKELINEGVKTYQYLVSFQDTITDAWKMAVQAFKTGDGTLVSLCEKSPDNNSMLENAFVFKDWTKSNLKENLMNTLTVMSRFMGASDEFITQLNYRAITKAKALNQAELGADTLQLIGKLREDYITKQTDNLFKQGFNVEGKPLDIQTYAEARDIVLQTPLDGKYIDYGTGHKVQVKNQTITMTISKALQKFIVTCPPAKIFFPFVRTGTNIMHQNLEHNALYTLFSSSQRRLLTSNTKEGAIARAQVATGLISFGAATAFVMQGRITGGAPVDQKTRDALYKTGWRPYSIRIGNKWISYEGYEPLQSILGFCADTFNIQQCYDTSASKVDWGTFAQLGIKAFMNNFLDKATFRNSIEQVNNIFELIETDDPKKISKALGKQARGFLPLSSLGNFVGNIVDPAQSKPTGFYQNLTNKYFAAGALGDYRRNIFGERQDMYNLIVNKAVDEDNSVENKEFQRLAELGWNPNELTTKDSKYKYDYTEFKGEMTGRSLHDLFLETQSEITLEGKTLREALAELIESDEYQYQMLDGITVEEQGTNNTRINNIKIIFKRYRDAAKEEVLREYGDCYVNKEGRTAAEEEQMIREAQEEALIDADLLDNAENIRSFS